MVSIPQQRKVVFSDFHTYLTLFFSFTVPSPLQIVSILEFPVVVPDFDNPFTQNPCEASVYVVSANNTWSCFRFPVLSFRILTKKIHQVFELLNFFFGEKMKNYVSKRGKRTFVLHHVATTWRHYRAPGSMPT